MDSKIIFHIDVNSAYLSWTAVKMLNEGSTIDIRKIPAVIGGSRKTRHGVVLAKSVPAKKFGIVTGEPITNALQKCPDIMIVPPEHDYYEMQSQKCMDLLSSFTPEIEQVSIDECYMDFSGIRNSYKTPLEAAYEIKDTIKNQLGFTVNIGISDVKVLAKMASDFTKPDKVHTLYRSEIKAKMWHLPVEELFMAGKSSVDTLHKLGIFNIGQLAASPVNILESHMKSHGRILWEYANGIDESVVNITKEEVKGVGNSVTLPYDFEKIEEISKVLLRLSEKVGGRLRSGAQMAKTIAVEVKYNDFTKVSKQTTIDKPTDSGTEIYKLSKELFSDLWNGKPIRLLGVRTANLVDDSEPEQMSIMDMFTGSLNLEKDGNNGKVIQTPSREKIKKLDKALDAIKEKYGEGSVLRASLLNNEERRVKSEQTAAKKEIKRTEEGVYYEE
ncbi:MAG: Y-family DNA polymerase [Eubacterium sp.]